MLVEGLDQGIPSSPDSMLKLQKMHSVFAYDSDTASDVVTLGGLNIKASWRAACTIGSADQHIVIFSILRVR